MQKVVQMTTSEPASPSQTSSPAAYAINGRACSLGEFTQTACDPLRSVVVEACAGAGKTHLLVTRMLRALAAPPEQGGAQPQEILAITFTKKAAGEMRQRLFDWLSLPEHQATYAKVLASGKTVEIRTFHSWFASLLRMAPLAVLDELRLPAGFDLVEDDTGLLDGAWRPFYEAVQHDPQLLADLSEVVASAGRHSAVAWLTAAWRKRAEFSAADRLGHVLQSVPPVQTGLLGDADLHPDLGFWASSVNQSVLFDAAKSLCAGTTRLLTQGKLLKAALAQTGAEQGIAAAHAALFTKTEPQSPRKLGDHADVRAAQDMLAQHMQARLLWSAWRMQQCMTRLTRCLLNAYGDHKRRQGVIDMSDVERAASFILADDVVGGWMQQRLDARVRHVMVDEFQDTNPVQWQALQAWLSGYAAGQASSDMSVFLVGDPKQNIYRFRGAQTGVFAAATRFVCDGMQGDLLTADHTWRSSQSVVATLNAAFLPLAELGEFADFRAHTSQSGEWGAVQMLPMVAKSGRGAKRGASAYEELAAGDGQAAGSGEGFVAGGENIATGGTGESDGVWRDTLRTPRELPASEKHGEAFEAVADWIASEVAAGVPAASFLVLGRTRKSLARLAPLLRQRGIAFAQADSAALRDACEVQDVTALLDALVSPSHNLALARALKSPIFNWPDTSLTALATLAEQSGQHWLPQLLDCADGLSPNLLQKIEQTNAVVVGQIANLLGKTAHTLRLWKFWLESNPPHDALTRIFEHRHSRLDPADASDGAEKPSDNAFGAAPGIEGPNLLERFAAAVPHAQRDAVLANLQAVLAHALGVGGGRFLTPYALVRALKQPGLKAATVLGALTQVVPGAAAQQRVRGMTVHKAKGLEADVVVLLDADAERRKPETFCVRVDWPASQSAPIGFVFLASTAKAPVQLQSVVAREELAANREALNVAYVALTRAKKRFVMSATEARTTDPFSAWRLFKDHASPMLSAPDEPNVPNTPQDEVAIPSESTSAFFMKKMPFVQHPRDLFAIDLVAHLEPETELSARMGRCMHRILQWHELAPSGSRSGFAVDGKAAGGDEAVLAAALEHGLTWQQASTSAQRAQAILAGDGAWVWDSACIVQAFNELPIVADGKDMRIDRLVQSTQGDWWVLDFKSASQDLHGGQAQVRLYMRAIERLAMGARVRGALLLADGQIVEIDAQG